MRRRSRPVPRLRFAAIVALLGAAGLVTFLVACPPSTPASSPPPSSPQAERPPEKPSGQSAAPAQPPAAPRPVSSALLPPERPQPEARALVAVIIDDAGYNLAELQRFLDLPIPLTVAVIPNLPHSTEAARRVLAAGKDLIVHGPMEPDGGENPGPGAIMTGQTPEEIRALLDADFASVPGAIGMNNHMGSKATADEGLMRVVLAYLREHGKLYIDSRTSAQTAGPRVAEELEMPILQRDVFLDDDPAEKEIAAWFQKSVAEARLRGSSVIIGHVQNGGVADILRAAAGTLASEGAHFVRLSEVLAARERKPAP